MNDKKKIMSSINNMLKVIDCSPELFHDGIDIEIKDLLHEIINYLNKKENKRLNNIINKAIEYIEHAQNYGTMAQVMPHLKLYVNGNDLLEILKGSDK